MSNWRQQWNPEKLKKIRLSQRESIMFVMVVFGLAFIYHQYWLKPKSAQLDVLRSKVLASHARIQENKILLEKLTTRSPASIEVQSNYELLDKYMKSNSHFSDVVAGIASSSKNDAFVLNKISSLKQTKQLGYTQTLYSIEVESSFIAIGKFLEKLEDSSLLTEVEGIEITRVSDEMKRCKASIKLLSYVSGGEI